MTEDDLYAFQRAFADAPREEFFALGRHLVKGIAVVGGVAAATFLGVWSLF